MTTPTGSDQTNATTETSTTANATGAPAAPPFQWSKFLVYLASICVLIMLAGLLVGMAVGLRPLEARAAKVVSHTPVKVEIVWPVIARPTPKAKPGAKAPTPVADEKPRTWLPQQQQEELLAIAQAAYQGTGAASFSRSPLERVGQALAASGWFEGTPKVRRSGDSTVTVEGVWRIPAALVRREGKDYLISWDAKPMPVTYEAGEAKSMRVIIDPALGPPANQDGSRDFSASWPGEDIAASLELLQLMADKPWYKQVAGIDASQYSGRGQLTLLTPEQTRVVWGGRPSKPAIGEVSTAQKLAYLAELMHDFGRIDARHELVYINMGTLQFDISASAGKK
jgi:hypothetical protein